jgi:atypical dual specificity phosphatase
MELSADLIDDRVWLGSLAAMQNTMALNSLHITHILSLIDCELPIDKNDSFIRKHIRVEDIETTDLLIEFDSCYDFIDKALSDDPTNNVLIHCLAG